MRPFTLSVADGVRQQAKNKKYSTHALISNVSDLSRAVQFDHIAGLFRNDERGNDNFLEADCIIMDCDNDHSDNPAKWLTPEKLAARFPDVAFFVVFSKSHMKEKHGRTARPRFHVPYPTSETITKAASIRELKERLLELVPEFDTGAKDAARFIYGVEQPQIEIYEGSMCIDEFIAINPVESLDDAPIAQRIDTPQPAQSTEQKPQTEYTQAETVDRQTQGLIPDVITAGDRHNTLLNVGLNALSKYGVDKARNLFFKAAERCNPPKPVDEVNRLWDWLLKRREAFKERFTQKKKTLTLQVIEKELQALNISLSFDVITRELEVSDLPQDNSHIPESYKGLNAHDKRRANREMLSLFLASHLRDKGFTFTDSFLNGGIAAIANIHRVNPVLEMIQATHWDGKDRIALLCRVLGIQDNELYCGLVRKWLHQAVSLALNDDGAINSEFVLVLQGAQGIGKTNFFRQLAIRPEWFLAGAVIDVKNKDTIIESTSHWLCELGELDATLKKEQQSLKAFITQNFDTCRKPYARKAEKIERRTCFCATVNPEGVLRDDSGSRRFVMIHIEAIDKPFVYEHMTPDWCSQLWRQVFETLYLKNGRTGFYLTEQERAFVEAGNREFQVHRDAEILLSDLLDWDSNPNTWEECTIAELMGKCPSLKSITPEKIGRALTLYAAQDERIKKTRVRKGYQYLLPRPTAERAFY